MHGIQAPTSPQTHRQKFLEGRGAGRENLFPKRFSSPQTFLSSHLQASACRPCRTMFFLRGDSLARSPTRHCSPAGERVSGTGTNIDDNSARPFPKTKKSPAERGQKKTPSRCELQGGLRTIFGSGLLSHMTLCSIIGDGELNFRVRNGVGCTLSSMATKEIWQIY